MKFNKVFSSFLVFSMITLMTSAAKVPRCGFVPGSSGNSVGGTYSFRGSWKWLVAFRYLPTNKFFCAGSLISAKHVISAAHCFWGENKPKKESLSPFEVIAWVGKYNLNENDEPGSVEHKICDILIHEDWKPQDDDFNFDADIALIVLETEVDLQQRAFVRTVCLPLASESEVTGNGTVVGWGISERTMINGELHEVTPMELRLPAVTRQQCFDADEKFKSFLSDRSFCAGFENQNMSVCKGDSGGGFFQFDSEVRAYKLIGIVSSSLVDFYGVCRVDTYSMFTSVGKFVGWIERKMEKTKENRCIGVGMACRWDRYVKYHECRNTYTGPFSRNIRLHQSYADATSVTRLDMNFEPSPYIFAGIGKNFPNLEVLTIIDQSIKFIERNNFKDMEQLQTLALYENQIEIIDEGTFNDLPNLVMLWLSGNKIKQLPNKIFNNLKNLGWIFLYNNKISTLPRYLFAENLKLERVDTFNNPGLTTNNVDFSKVPNVQLWNETEYKYYQRGEHFHDDGRKIQ